MTNEIWQVVVGEEVYEADLETLKHWINEGRVHPNNLVKKGNLNWIEVQRVPALRTVLNNIAANNSNNDATAPITNAANTPPTAIMPNHSSTQEQNQPATGFEPQPYHPPSFAQVVKASNCKKHPEYLAAYICMNCGTAFCNSCIQSATHLPPNVCQLCGGHCETYQDAIKLSDQLTGFNFSDIKQAFSYAWRALGSGVLVYLGGLIFGVVMSAILITISSKTVEIFLSYIVAEGRQDALILYGSGFSALTIITYFLVMMVILVPIFGYAFAVIKPVATGNKETRYVFSVSSLWANIGHTLVSVLGYSFVMLWSVVLMLYMAKFGVSIVTVILACLLAPLLIWQICFYYPVALINGYTKSLLAVINPLTWIDTIKRLGANYWKIWVIYFATICSIAAIGVINELIFHIVLPQLVQYKFNLGKIFSIMLDVTAFLILTIVIFYLNTVIAYLVGRVLYKHNDELGIIIE
ncbi:MAG: B-box zinc finger protein [Acidobacteriota bacterium]